MIENLRTRLIIVAVVLMSALIWTFPNFVDVKTGKAADKEKDKSRIWWPSSDKLSYGLDIRGGLHLVMGIDVEGAMDARLTKMGYNIKQSLKEEHKVDVKSVEPMDLKSGKLRIYLNNPGDLKAVTDYMEDSQYGMGRSLQIIDSNAQYVDARFYETELRQFKKNLVDRTIETIRNRIDAIGVKEPTIAAQSGARILVQIPGIEDAADMKNLINQAAQLFFMIVDPDFSPGAANSRFPEVEKWIAEAEQAGNYSLKENQNQKAEDGKLKYSEYLKRLHEDLKDKLPKDRVIRFQQAPNAKSLSAGKIPYVLRADAQMSGETLTDAFPVQDSQTGQPIVSFTLDAKGAKEFGDLTSANVKQLMAIVLDGVVKSAPVLNEGITGGRGQITMGGSGDFQARFKEAENLAIVLRSGALPAELEQLEERTVGPTLGADSIEKGKFAGLVGGLLVFIFMIGYYRSYGILADLALAFNILLVLAVLTSLQATLTLPGVAGIALTIGMSVDANVIIFERIKEELRKGAGLAAAIKEGYARAFGAIIDANVTTAAVCVVLMYFGTGPIRGFAVTLICGIITSMFTAIFVTRAILDLCVGKWKWNLAPRI